MSVKENKDNPVEEAHVTVDTSTKENANESVGKSDSKESKRSILARFFQNNGGIAVLIGVSLVAVLLLSYALNLAVDKNNSVTSEKPSIELALEVINKLDKAVLEPDRNALEMFRKDVESNENLSQALASDNEEKATEIVISLLDRYMFDKKIQGYVDYDSISQKERNELRILVAFVSASSNSKHKDFKIKDKNLVKISKDSVAIPLKSLEGFADSDTEIVVKRLPGNVWKVTAESLRNAFLPASKNPTSLESVAK